jgi:hypothetical protein
LEKTQLNPHSLIGLKNHEKLTNTIRYLKTNKLADLNDYLAKLDT